MIIREPVFAEVIAVAGGVVIVRDSPERVKVVFIVRMEDCSCVIDRRVIEFCVVLREFLVGEVNVELEVILWGRRRVVINLYKTIFKSLKLVKQLLKGK